MKLLNRKSAAMRSLNPPTIDEVRKIRPGAVVEAVRPLADDAIPSGTVGIVFEGVKVGKYKLGPRVRWLLAGYHECRVYDGDVKVLVVD